jgi:RNA polymerase sigma-70 factor, ECF subfamily
MQAVDEAELIARTKQADHAAYAELVDRYKNAVYHHCFAVVRDEDIAQDTFIAAYYKIRKYNPDYKLATWLFRIATNKALNHLKKAAKEFAAEDELLASFPAAQPSPHTAAEFSELHDAVRQLTPRYRAVISLYYWQGLSYQDVADVMDSPLGSIKVWMARAKDQLRKELS